MRLIPTLNIKRKTNVHFNPTNTQPPQQVTRTLMSLMPIKDTQICSFTYNT